MIRSSFLPVDAPFFIPKICALCVKCLLVTLSAITGKTSLHEVAKVLEFQL